MKSIKNLVLALAITFSTVLSASTNPTNEKPLVLETEIGTLLEKPEFKITNDLLAKVTFVLNKNNEIVVLSVLTDNSQLENFIKSRLNYKKIEASGKVNEPYVMPVSIKVK